MWGPDQRCHKSGGTEAASKSCKSEGLVTRHCRQSNAAAGHLFYRLKILWKDRLLNKFLKKVKV
jgi:hypothetical protein